MCKFAYEIPGVDYLLCKCFPKPDAKDRKAVFHASCPHQTFCQTARCNRMTEGWQKCYTEKSAVTVKFTAAEAPKEEKPVTKTRKSAKKVENVI